MTKTVAILGASKNKSRYANKAQKLLVENGYSVVPINPKYNEIDGIKCYPSLSAFGLSIDTVTVYVKPSIFSNLIHNVIETLPKKVIFNPGTEKTEFLNSLRKENIDTEEACTLVLLRTNQF